MELVSALAANDIEVSFSELKSSFGHDAFFLEEGQLTYILTKFLEDYVVEDLMKEDVPTIKENAEIKDAAILMVNQQITHLPVITDENKLIGIVTSWDLSKSIASGCNGLKDVMTKNVKYCNATDTIESVAETMRKHEISSLPVVDESLNLKGLISMDQVSHLI